MVTTGGTLWCWSSPRPSSTPAQIGTDSDWSSVTAQRCAIKTDGTLWCWGDNDLGQLGDGTAWSDLPVEVAP